MKQIYQHITLLWCLLFGEVYTHNCPETPDTTSSPATDPAWRLISGLDAAGTYSLYTQLREMSQPPLVNTLNGDSENQDVENLIDGVCELITFFELVSGADSTSDSTFQALLSAVVKDSCLWLDYLVSTHPNVSSSEEYSSLPSSCDASDATRIHHYCLQRKIRGEQLRLLIHSTLSDSLHMYYSDVAPASRPREWVQTNSFTGEQKTRILNII